MSKKVKITIVVVAVAAVVAVVWYVVKKKKTTADEPQAETDKTKANANSGIKHDQCGMPILKTSSKEEIEEAKAAADLIISNAPVNSSTATKKEATKVAASKASATSTTAASTPQVAEAASDANKLVEKPATTSNTTSSSRVAKQRVVKKIN